jgi:hypothetical protein
VKSIRDSVIRASDTLAALSDRHEAFGHLVIRFQDMAFAYSFVVPVVNPALLDEYSGSYRVKRSQSPMTLEVRNENGRLTLECVGQKVELFPTTESYFFIKYFYGEVAFVRNDEGHVKELDFMERRGDSVDRFRAIKFDEEKHT